MKNDLAISGTLHSVDQFLNVKLTNTKVVNEAKYPHMVSMKMNPPCTGMKLPHKIRRSDWKRQFGPHLNVHSDVGPELLHPR